MMKEDKQERRIRKAEQLSVILWRGNSRTASMYTNDAVLIRELMAKVEAFPEAYQLDRIDDYGTHFFFVPIDRIAFRNPASEKKKDAGRKNREKRKDL